MNVKDIITGTSGNEIINGNGGDDTINGGAGDDTMYGGTGSDTYLFTEWSSNDVVSDVSGANDLLDISQLTGTIEYQKSGTDLKIVETSGKGNITVKVYIANEDESSNGILAKNATIDLNSENTVLNVD